jgi:hypothetical protein
MEKTFSDKIVRQSCESQQLPILVPAFLTSHRRLAFHRQTGYYLTGESMSASRYEAELRERKVRQKRWEAVVSSAVAEVEASVLKGYSGFHHVTFFGAMGIDPKHLAVWCFFATDDDLKRAEDERFTGVIQRAMRDTLAKHGYPTSLLPSVFVSFATDEDVQRTCAGNYWHYLK